MRKERLIPATAGIVILMLVIATCAERAPPPAKTVRFALLPSLDQSAYHVMVDQRFAAERGIRLQHKIHEGGPAAIRAVADGEADAAFPGIFPLIAATKDGSVPERTVAVAVVILVDPAHPVNGFFVGGDIQGWKDLTGKRVAINAEGSVAHIAAAIRLRNEGVTDVSFVEISFANMGLAVAGGSVAAASMFEPYLTQSKQRGDGRLLDWVIGGPPFERFLLNGLLVSRSLLEDDPARVRALIAAHLDATAWIAEREAQAREVIARSLNLTSKVSDAVGLVQWSLDGVVDRDLFAELARVAADEGVSEGSVALEDVFDEGPLRAVLRERKGG